MPNNMTEPNKGKNMPHRNDHGAFTDDKNRRASKQGHNKGYGKDDNMGRQGSGSQTSEHMSDIGRKAGQD